MSGVLRTIVKEDVQRILDHFCYSLDIRILLYTADGSVLRVGLNRPDSPYCTRIRSLYGAQRCLTLDRTMREHAAKERDLICYRCHAGLNECVEPILVGGTPIGYAMIGQFRTSRSVPTDVMAGWKRNGGLKTDLERAFELLPVYDDKKQGHIVGLFRLLVEYVVSKELISVEGSLLIERIRAHVLHNIHRRISIAEVAATVERSPSTVSHTIRRETNRSFTQLCAEIKVDYAEYLMSEEPEMTIAEVAERLGYSDQFYFSRVYKKVRGCPPSRFRLGAPGSGHG
jgi:AraC-like DNA-binding protein/ligand-binding sensor protein